MIYEIMALAVNSPQTGDNFPVTKLLIIGGAALGAAVGAGIFAMFKKDNKDE